MLTYPKTKSSLPDIIKQSFQHYFSTLKLIFISILLCVVVKDLYLFLGVLPHYRMMYVLLDIIIFILQVFIWSVALCRVHNQTCQRPIEFWSVLRQVWVKKVDILLGVFGILLLICAIGFVGLGLAKLITWVFFIGGAWHQFILLIFVALPILISLALMVYTLPILAIDNTVGWLAIRLSIQLVNWCNFSKGFILYAAIVVIYTCVSTETVHGMWMLRHHLSLPFNLLILVLLAPLVVNYSLLSLHDLRQK